MRRTGWGFDCNMVQYWILDACNHFNKLTNCVIFSFTYTPSPISFVFTLDPNPIRASLDPIPVFFPHLTRSLYTFHT